MRKWILLIFSLLFVVGCGRQPAVVLPETPTFTNPHVQIQSPSLYKWLKFDSINYMKREDGLIEFEAVFTNFIRFNKIVAYKIEWKDKNGFIKKTIMSRWATSIVEAGRQLVIRGISPSADVTDFTIILQQQTRDDKKRQDPYHRQYNN